MTITIETKFPIALDSPDHMVPSGTKNDNNTNAKFVQEVKRDLMKSGHFPGQLMDLGCAGGLLVHDLVRDGHLAIGLEGSDDNIKNNRFEWPLLHNKNLFTCDVCRQFSVWIEDDRGKRPFECDLITAWEVIEHIPPNRLKAFFENIRVHLKTDGKFVGSISLAYGPPYHQSVFRHELWKEKILKNLKGLKLLPYPYRNVVRKEPTSFYIMLKRSD